MFFGLGLGLRQRELLAARQGSTPGASQSDPRSAEHV